MYSKGLGKEIREDELAPGYFFYGEESYFADLFVRELTSLLAPGDSPDFRTDRFYLDESDWGEILDTARNRRTGARDSGLRILRRASRA